MEVKNKVMPNDQQIADFNELDEEKPIFMVNLLKFKEKAEYADKRETCLLYTSQSPRDRGSARMPSYA